MRFELKTREIKHVLLYLYPQDQVLANLVVEEEPGGDERVGEDSQDESTTSTSAPHLNTVAPDEDTLPSSLDDHESPTPPEMASTFSVDSDSSNSSMDVPLLHRRETAGPKRKAEVLKESGKIGVTITTSSPNSSSSSPPPNKVPRLLPLKNNSTAPSYHVSVVIVI